MAYQFIEDFDSPNYGKYFVGETNQNHPEEILVGADGSSIYDAS